MSNNQQQPSSSDMLKEAKIFLNKQGIWVLKHYAGDKRFDLVSLLAEFAALQSSVIPSMKEARKLLAEMVGACTESPYYAAIWSRISPPTEDWLNRASAWLDESPASSSVIPHKEDNSVEP